MLANDVVIECTTDVLLDRALLPLMPVSVAQFPPFCRHVFALVPVAVSVDEGAQPGLGPDRLLQVGFGDLTPTLQAGLSNPERSENGTECDVIEIRQPELSTYSSDSSQLCFSISLTIFRSLASLSLSLMILRLLLTQILQRASAWRR